MTGARLAMPDDQQLSMLISRKLDIINLLLDRYSEAPESQIKTKVMKLYKIGVTVSEISQIINKPNNYISALITTDRKRKSAKATREDKSERISD